jgi:hypothetical protein
LRYRGDPAIEIVCSSYANTGKNTPLNTFDRVEVRGLDSYGDGTAYWSTGISINNMATTNFRGVGVYGAANIAGTGIVVAGSENVGGVPSYATVFNLDGCVFYALDTTFFYGTRVQGVSLISCNTTRGRVGIKVADGAQGLDQLAIVSSQFGGMSYAALQCSAKVNCLSMSNNLMIVPANAWGAIVNSDSFTLTGNVVAGTGASDNKGFDILDSIQGVISGNSFSDVAVGIQLRAKASGVVGEAFNSCRNVTTTIAHLG